MQFYTVMHLSWFYKWNKTTFLTLTFELEILIMHILKCPCVATVLLDRAIEWNNLC